MIGRLLKISRGLFIAAVPLMWTAADSHASTVSVSAPASGLTVQVNSDDGEYQITSQNPPWKFAGSLGLPVKDVTSGRGSDDLGSYQQISFGWQAGAMPMSASIKVYDDKSLALFSQTCGTASEMPPAAFPAFKQLPQSLHVFSYGDSNFAPPEFDAVDTSTPWLLFDDHANAVIISPASHYMVASMLGDGQKEIESGFNPNLRNLPAGFTQQTLVAFGNGINKTWDLWGQALLNLEHAQRPGDDADSVLKYLGYWTDNGAFYYYNYDMEKGYAGTLQSLVDHYRQEQIPIRYLQLDSWWYYKTTTGADGTTGANKKSRKLPAGEWNRYGGLLLYKAHPYVFPDGLDNFQKSIDLPLITHNRWIDPASPYHQHYQISGIAAVDPKWWSNIADYMKVSGITTYEQDWLDHIYAYSPAFSSNLDTGAAFLDDMSSACMQNGITMQYCMALPCYFLQGSHYGNLTTIRVSGDRFTRNKWNNFLYTSRLAESLGIWPWADVYMSTETDNVLLSTLSAGPVGVGDAMGTEDKTNLLRAVRGDGVIVKPDAPIVPLDQSYLADAQGRPSPLTAGTFTDHQGIKTAYIFAVNRPNAPTGDVNFSSADLGMSGPAYVYDYFSGVGKLLDGGDFSAPLNKDASAFYVIAPVGKSGIAFLGDKDKFVGTGKQRITSLEDQSGKLTVGIALAANETSVTLHGFASVAPKVSVISGADDDVQYNPATHYFFVKINTDTNASLDKSGADPVRQMTVELQTQAK
ncbi:MAG TPA: hypothetical protein VGI03_05105 [Verrucomicrobiae bacterium]|jgi:hypothetical protein